MIITINKAFLILFIAFPVVIIHSKASCPNSSCGSSFFPIKYPFKLEEDQPPINCYNLINLRCDDQGHTLINLPYFGDFYVTDINYNHRKIALTYLQNCLPRMLMTNFSLSPLAAFAFENHTFYTCDEDPFTRRFEIKCLRNSTNEAVVVTREGYVQRNKCKPIVSSMIPVSSSSVDKDWESSGYLELTWDFPRCRHCELVHDPEKQEEDAKRKLAKLITGSTVFIPLVVIFTTFFGIACFIRLLKLIVGGGSATTTESSTPEGSETAAAAPPPPRTTNTTPKVGSFSEVMVLDENHQETMICCSICLEEYHGKDMVRNLAQCGHLFHAECIDQWLQKNTTCPMCRTPLSVL